jgi:hypothetical protein
MIKRIAGFSLGLILLATSAFAASFPSLTYTLLASGPDGTLISATKVMQNYNDLLNALKDGTKKINVAEIWINGIKVIDNAGNYLGGGGGNFYVDFGVVYGYTTSAFQDYLADYPEGSDPAIILFKGAVFYTTGNVTVASDQKWVFVNGALLTSSVGQIDFNGIELVLGAGSSIHATSGGLVITGNITFESGAFLNVTGVSTLLQLNNVNINANANDHVFYCTGATVTGNIANGIIYPEWFGAQGDNSTDCYEAITYAFQLIPTFATTIEDNPKARGIVRFGPGTYLTRDGFIPRPYTIIEGAGRSVTEIKVKDNRTSANFVDTCGALFYVNGGPSVASEKPSRYIVFRNIALHGNDQNPTNAALAYDGIRWRRTQYSGIENCEIKSFPRSGVVYAYHSGDVDYNSSLWLEHCLIRDSNGPQVVIEKTYNLDIMDSTIRTGSDVGILFQNTNSDRVRIKNIQFNQNGKQAVTNVSGNSTTSVQIGECEFYYVGKYTTENGAIDINGGTEWQVNNNYFYGNLGPDILADCNRGQFNNNYFFESQKEALIIATGSYYVQANNNFAKDSSRITDNAYDAYVINGHNSTVVGNTAKYSGSGSQMRYGMWIGPSADNSYIANNDLVNSGLTGEISCNVTTSYLVENMGIGQDVAFKYKFIGTISNVPVDTQFVCTFNYKLFDNSNRYSTTTGRITAAWDGVYFLGTDLRGQEVASTNYIVAISVVDADGVTQNTLTSRYDLRDFSVDPTYWPFHVSGEVLMRQNWYAVVEFYQDGSTQKVDFDDNSYFYGHYVRDYR